MESEPNDDDVNHINENDGTKVKVIANAPTTLNCGIIQ
jgi:hypothetical protein